MSFNFAGGFCEKIEKKVFPKNGVKTSKKNVSTIFCFKLSCYVFFYLEVEIRENSLKCISVLTIFLMGYKLPPSPKLWLNFTTKSKVYFQENALKIIPHLGQSTPKFWLNFTTKIKFIFKGKILGY